MIPIIDAHHHIWRKNDLAWLSGPMQPRIFGPYEPIRRDYPIEEYLADLDGCGVVGSVYVQTNWPKGGELDEVRWVEAEARRSGWPQAIVSYLDLLDVKGAEAMLDAQQAASPRLRGVRMQLHWHENPLYRFAADANLMGDARLRRNLAMIAERGLLFDFQIFASQMRDGAALAADLPGLPFVLMHAGMLEDLSPQGRSAWREGMRRLADQPNVHVKLSGLGTFLHRCDPAHVEDVTLQTVEMFGPERCVFGSNFPIEKLWTSYPALVEAHRRALSSLDETAQRRILHDNAASLYRLAGA
ncbi:amidohydrolase family protein [Geminicoccus roseus]|uniref:amidohydrolase family protein n=1 Tax=Geminicoccus roseus TaxID=404900 RepID=UPI0003F593BF|nr:amidohydrolase family protein [Geminicoccus roseus]